MPESATDVNVTVEKKADAWRIVERIGVAVVLLVLLGSHFMRQDSSKQDFIQKQAADIALQAKLDRQEERLNAQKTQEKLVEVITSQVAATTEQIAESKAARSAIEQNSQTNAKVSESMAEFNGAASDIVERIDRLVDHVEVPK